MCRCAAAGARKPGSRLRTLVRLAGDTGRRIGAILALRWSDWRPELGKNGKLRWRAEEDKVGREWFAPVTPEVRAELERLRQERPGVGEALLFPMPNDPSRPLRVENATDLLRRAEKLAGRKHLSPKDVAAVGGWIDTATLQKCYQVADEETMEAVVLQPKRLRKMG